MSVDFLPNTWSPTQMATAQAHAVRRARLFNAPAPIRKPIHIPPPVAAVVEPEPEPIEEEQPVDTEPSKTPTAWTVMRAVCRKYRITMEQLRSASRRRDIIRARHECFHVMRNEVPWLGRRMSLPEIGHLFGMDHSTILHGIRQHTRRLAGEIE